MHFEAHSYGCLMLRLPKAMADKVMALSAAIPDEFIYEGDDGDMGREDKPHITIKYGLHTGDDEEVREKLESRWPVRAKLGKASIFESDDYIVLKMAVTGTPLRALNAYVCKNFKCTDTFPDYNPHATIAYLKKNEDDPDYWREFASDELEGEEFEGAEVEWSPADGDKVMIPLEAERPAARVARIAMRVAKLTWGYRYAV